MGVKNSLLRTIRIDRTYGPDVQAQKMTPVRTGRMYGRSLRPVRMGSVYRPLACNKNDQYLLLSILYNVSLWRRTNHSDVWSSNTISYQHKLGGKDEAIRATSMVLTLTWCLAGRQGIRIIHQHHPRALVARKRFYMYHYLFITMSMIIINAVNIHKYGRNCLLDGG